MSEESGDLETRLAALEFLVAYLFASQHLQTADPAAALDRLQMLLRNSEDGETPARWPEPTVRIATERLLELMATIQETIPKRLVD